MNANKISAICADILAKRRTEMTMSWPMFQLCESMYDRIMQCVRYQALRGDYKHIGDGNAVRISGMLEVNVAEASVLGKPLLREQFTEYMLARLKADNFTPNCLDVDAVHVTYYLTLSLLP